jgi:hypothetical protein
MICARPGGAVTQVGFKPTAPRTSPTQGRGMVLRHVSARPGSRRSSDADVRDRDYFLSLSSDYKEENTGRSLLFSIFPITEVSYRRRLAAVWLHDWAIPRAQLIPTPSRFY